MKTITIYKFGKNKAQVSLSYGLPNQKDSRVKDDCLWLEWKTQEGEKRGVGMRPDEALLISEMLTMGVRCITETYNTSKPIKSYRIK